MLILGCVEHHVLIYESCKIHHLNLEGTTESRIVYNHHRKTTKIENGWRNFVQSQNFLSGTQI